jgi:hypothetical protein
VLVFGGSEDATLIEDPLDAFEQVFGFVGFNDGVPLG